MTRLLIVPMLACLLLGVSSAAPVPDHLQKAPVYYYPIKVGAKWMWNCNFVTPRESQIVLSHVEMVDDVYTVTTVGLDDGSPAEKVRVSAQGLFLLERGGAKFDPPVCSLRLPLKPGDEWETTSTFAGQRFHFKHKVGKPEWIKVPAGRFEAIPVVHETEINSRGGIWPQTDWYAPGVGCIKSTTPGGMNHVLKSFTPAK